MSAQLPQDEQTPSAEEEQTEAAAAVEGDTAVAGEAAAAGDAAQAAAEPETPAQGETEATPADTAPEAPQGESAAGPASLTEAPPAPALEPEPETAPQAAEPIESVESTEPTESIEPTVSVEPIAASGVAQIDEDAPEDDEPEVEAPEEPAVVAEAAPQADQPIAPAPIVAQPEAPEEPAVVAEAAPQADQPIAPAPVVAQPEVDEEPAAEEDEEPATPAIQLVEGSRWYILQTYSGFENRVKKTIEEKLRVATLGHLVEEIFVPGEDVTRVKNGRKRTQHMIYFPGYVLVKMVLSDELWHLLMDIPRVAGFVGGNNREPQPLQDDELSHIRSQMSEGFRQATLKDEFEVGQPVIVIDGPFANFSGKIDEVNIEKNKLRVLISILGRSTPVELDFDKVKAHPDAG